MSNNQLDFSSLEIPDEFTAEVEDVTPEMAAWMLQFNNQNRKLNERLVDELVRQIHADGFLLNGESIKLSRGVPLLDPDGKPVTDGEGHVMKVPLVVDGQHRLEAIKKSGKTVKILVVRGLDPDTQATVDTGRKRTTADVMRISGERESANLGAMLAGIWKWNAGDRKFGTNPKPSPAEAKNLLAEDSDRIRRSLEVGLQTGRSYPDLSKSSLAISHYLLCQVDPGLQFVPYMFHLIATGFDLSDGNPVAALRTRATRYRHGGQKQKMTMSRQVGLVINAWNNCVKNEAVSTLIQGENDPVNEPLNPRGRDIPFLTSATFKDAD